MSFGRPYRKLAAQNMAFVLFRWAAFWVLVVMCASRPELIGELFAIVIVAIDIAVGAIVRSTQFFLVLSERKDWLDRLTTRIFTSMIVRHVHDGLRPDFDLVSIDAGEAATKDVLRAEKRDETVGFFDSTAWHWFGGLLSFVWLAATYLTYYGSAFLVAHRLRY